MIVQTMYRREAVRPRVAAGDGPVGHVAVAAEAGPLGAQTSNGEERA